MESRLLHVRKEGIKLRIEEASRYSLMENRENFRNSGGHSCEYLWYVKNRNYDVSIGMKIGAYNLVFLLNQKYH